MCVSRIHAKTTFCFQKYHYVDLTCCQKKIKKYLNNLITDIHVRDMGNSGCQTWHEMNFNFFQQITIGLKKCKARFTEGSVLYEFV